MTILKNQPFHVVADHNGTDTATYDLVIDGTLTSSQPVSALTAGAITFSNVIVTVIGPHTVAVRAVGSGGSAVSTTLSFDVALGVPLSPTNIRLIVA